MKAALNVLFVTRKYPPMVGGMESYSYHLTQGYPEPKTIIKLARRQSHLFWFLPYATARTALTSFRYDVVHVGDALLAVVGLVPRYVFGKKVFVTVHGLDLTFKVRVYQWYLRHFLRADAYIAVSRSTADIAKARGLEPVHVIPNGVQEEQFRIERDPDADAEVKRFAAGRVVLLTVGRLVKRKGVEWFVQNVLPDLKETVYVVVGEGTDRQAIESACRKTGVADRVLMLGSVSKQRLEDLYRSADIFVMPNIEVPGDVEGFGITALEAAAAGLPVVAANLQGIPDAIRDAENGVLVEAGRAQPFITVLRKLIADRVGREELGARAREFTREYNSWRKIVERYQSLFEGALAGRESRF